MKKIAQFTSQTQAHLVSEALSNQDIKSEVIGSKDYSSIVTGSDFGKYDLMVDWSDEAEALKIVNQIQNQELSQHDRASILPTTFIKRAIVFSLLASVFLPIVFNYVAYKNLREYLKVEQNSSKKITMLILITLLQIPTIIVVYMVLHEVVNS